MSEPLKVGDWVVVAYDACCANPRAHLGMIFQIARFVDFSNLPCRNCGKVSDSLNASPSERSVGYDTLRLKRIPPLSELEGEKRDEEITA